MAISFVSESNKTQSGWNNATPNVLTAPAGILDGDLLVAIAQRFTLLGTLSLPTGFTEWDSSSYPNIGGDSQVVTGYKYASSESGDYAFTTTDATAGNRNEACIAVYRGVTGTDPLDVPFSSVLHTVIWEDDPTPTAQPITTNTDNSFAVILQVAYDVTVGLHQQVAGYTEASWGDAANDGTFGRFASIRHKLITPAGVETPADFNDSSLPDESTWLATIALKEAGGAALPILSNPTQPVYTP